jgi:hypothetical protein
LDNIISPFQLLLLQFFTTTFTLREFPAAPVFYKQFPVFKRFRCASLSFAIVRAIMFVITSFGLVYLVDYFGNWGFLVLILPFTILYGLGLRHFEGLEKA